MTSMWLAAGGVAVVLAALGVMLWLARKAGRDAQRINDLARADDVKAKQLDAAARAQATPRELVERMRKGGM